MDTQLLNEFQNLSSMGVDFNSIYLYYSSTTCKFLSDWRVINFPKGKLLFLVIHGPLLTWQISGSNCIELPFGHAFYIAVHFLMGFHLIPTATLKQGLTGIIPILQMRKRRFMWRLFSQPTGLHLLWSWLNWLQGQLYNPQYYVCLRF